jgi:twitching motility two-component system response regulator PilH
MANILIVDDSITIAKYIETVLSAEGHKLTLAADGVDAESKLRCDCFDLIITDVVMPRKNGFQLCRDLKSNVLYKHIPIIMLTTKSLDADKFWGKRQGANEYVVKSPNADGLIEAVNKHISKKVDEQKNPANIPLPSATKSFFSRFRN